MELHKAINWYVLGNVIVDDLPAIAQEALKDGWDSPSLRQLAAAEELDAPQIRKLFSMSMDEIGVSTPSPSAAGLAAARFIAEEVLKSSITPYVGAKQIWRDVYTRVPELSRLRVFVGLASEYEDDEKNRADYSNQIMEECRALLSE